MARGPLARYLLGEKVSPINIYLMYIFRIQQGCSHINMLIRSKLQDDYFRPDTYRVKSFPDEYLAAMRGELICYTLRAWFFFVVLIVFFPLFFRRLLLQEREVALHWVR